MKKAIAMKKAMASILFAAGVLAAIMIYRAETVFQDHQIAPAARISKIDIHIIRAFNRFSGALRIKHVHGTDEHIAVEDYLRAIRFYYHLIRQSMAG